MIIQKKIYQEISDTLSNKILESGGLLGGNSAIITCFYFDKKGISNEKSYVPDTKSLTNVLKKWYRKNIEWIGVLHSHQRNYKPSEADLKYLEKILKYKIGIGQGEKILFGIFVIDAKMLYLYEASISNQNFIYKEIQYAILEEIKNDT